MSGGAGVVPDGPLSSALQALFPECPNLRVVALTTLPDLHAAYPEAEPDGAMAPARRREFRAGRACARLALRQAGGRLGPIPVGSSGAPVWPEGFCGSITHDDGLVAAAVMPSDGDRGIGIDVASGRRTLPERAAHIVCTPRERDWIATAGPAPASLEGWPRLFFCLKEAVFKAQPSAATETLGLGDYSVHIDLQAGRFAVVEASVDRVGAGLLRTRGRFVVRDGRVIAGAMRGSA